MRLRSKFETIKLSRHLGLMADVANEEEVIKVVNAAEQWFGPVNVVVNAAGINQDSLLVRTKTSEMLRLLNTNLLGTMITTKTVLRSMLHQKEGCIINIGKLLVLVILSSSFVQISIQLSLKLFT